MSSQQAPAAWLKFLSELQKSDVRFEDIQDTDAKTREELIADITVNWSKLEKAVVSSHWNKLNASHQQQVAAASSASTIGSPTHTASAAGGILGLLSNAGNNNNATTLVPHLGNIGQPGAQHQQLQQHLGFGSGGSYGNTPRDVAATAGTSNIGGYLVSNDGISFGQGSGPFDPTALRAALNRGDATSALPAASEMLQKDPLALCQLLHDFAPHLSVATIKSILGLDGGPPGRGLPPAIAAATGLESPTRFGAFDGNDVASAKKGGVSSPGDVNNTIAMVNGQQVPVGQVLTAVTLSAQYGHGFSITCNGQLVHLPYCVQPGDRVLVTAQNNA